MVFKFLNFSRPTDPRVCVKGPKTECWDIDGGLFSLVFCWLLIIRKEQEYIIISYMPHKKIWCL